MPKAKTKSDRACPEANVKVESEDDDDILVLARQTAKEPSQQTQASDSILIPTLSRRMRPK